MPSLHKPMPQPAAMERGPTEDSCFLTQTSVGTRSLGLEALAKGAVASTTHPNFKCRTFKPMWGGLYGRQAKCRNTPNLVGDRCLQVFEALCGGGPNGPCRAFINQCLSRPRWNAALQKIHAFSPKPL